MDLEKVTDMICKSLRQDEHVDYEKVEIISGPYEIDLLIQGRRFRVQVAELELRTTNGHTYWMPKK